MPKVLKTDYVDLKDGRYYTKEALAEKYDVSEFTVRERVKVFGIPSANVLGRLLYRDDPRYAKVAKTKKSGEHLPKVSNYVVLFQKVERCERMLEEICLNLNIPIPAGFQKLATDENLANNNGHEPEEN